MTRIRLVAASLTLTGAVNRKLYKTHAANLTLLGDVQMSFTRKQLISLILVLNGNVNAEWKSGSDTEILIESNLFLNPNVFPVKLPPEIVERLIKIATIGEPKVIGDESSELVTATITTPKITGDQIPKVPKVLDTMPESIDEPKITEGKI
jgi:hypothetical protein